MRISGSLGIYCFTLVCAGAAFAVPAAPPEGYFDYDPKADPTSPESWKESETGLPPYPHDPDLLPIPLSARDTLKVYIDQKSLSRAADGVLRFTLVVESVRGARSVLFEGMRCETREYKTYAIGTRERRLQQVKDPRWKQISDSEINAFRYALFKHYACDDAHTARTPKELVQRAARGTLSQ